MGVFPLSKNTLGISGYTKISIVFIIIEATTTFILPVVEPAYSTISQESTEVSVPLTASQALSQHIRQLVKELEYSDEVAENFANMVNTWQDKQTTPILVICKQMLCQAKENYKQGKISKKHLAETEYSIATKLTYRIRKEITVNDNFFDLADVIKHKQTQCLGYSQLFYILGTSVELSVRPINVLELQTPGPLPSGSGHVACMVDLADGRTIMLNLVPAGFISYPFIFEEKFTNTGNYWELKDKTNSLNIYRKIQPLDREGLIAYICSDRGVNYTSSGQLDKAASDYDRAINLNPACAEAWSNRASLYLKLNRFEEAISDFNRAIECNPHLAGTWNNRANAYAKTGQFDKAISDYNHAVKLNSKLVEVYYNRATIYGILGRYEQSISDFNRAIKLNPNLTQAYYNRGNAYAKLKQFDRAIADYNRAIGLSPNFAKALGNRAAAYALSGDSVGAK